LISKNGWPIEKGRNGLSVWRLNRILSIIHNRANKLTEVEREIPIVWSEMHMYSTMQLAKLVAMQRDLNPEFAGLVCAFHDIYTLLKGRHKDHGLLAKKYIVEVIAEYNENTRDELSPITKEEQQCIIDAVKVHSNKNTVEENVYAELLKDVDSLDSYLSGNTPGYRSGRMPRINALFTSLNIEHIVE